MESIDQFDPQFFGVSPREAPYIDPQQRLLLETAWEAIEDAGLVLDFEKGTDIGVFVGISHNDYHGLHHLHAGLSHAELPGLVADLHPTTPGEKHPFPSYWHALQDLFRCLADPRVGSQWGDIPGRS